MLEYNVDSLHQVEYGASASVLTLLPTIGALFGSPTSEMWALLKVCPPAWCLALWLSFGGSLLPTHSQDYVNVFRKQGLSAFHASSESLNRDDNEVAFGPDSRIHTLHQRISDGMKPIKRRRLGFLRTPALLSASMVAQFILVAAVMAGMAIVEQGAVYTTACTITFWMQFVVYYW